MTRRGRGSHGAPGAGRLSPQNIPKNKKALMATQIHTTQTMKQ
nr:MAG TPA: hypothetical protein [Bacteriophage sp.]